MSSQILRALEEHSINEKYLLEEYKEQGFCWRHDDDVFSKLTAVLLPLSIAALTLPYLRDETPKLLATSGGLMLMMFWYLSSESYEQRFKIRWTRIHEIERILGLDSHLRIDRKRSKSLLKGQRLRRCMFGLYLLIAFCVTCDLKVEVISWPLDWWIIKSVITTETLVFFFIVVIVFIVFIAVCISILIRIGWRRYKRCRYDRRLKRSPRGA